MAHRNAPLTPAGRLLLCRRIEAGSAVAHVAAAMGISRRCAHKWWRRYLELGAEGLVDRSSRPRRSPRRTPAPVEARVVKLRRQGLGPERIAARLNLAASTVHQVLCRHGLNRLDRMDRASGRVIRRYERAVPGELVHVDVKKLGRIPAGGGHKIHYVREGDRTRALARWLHMYNHHRPHSSLGGRPPISRVTNVPGEYT